MSPTTTAVLGALSDTDPRTVGQIGDLTRLSHTNIRKQLARLESARLVTRIIPPPNGAKPVHLFKAVPKRQECGVDLAAERRASIERQRARVQAT